MIYRDQINVAERIGKTMMILLALFAIFYLNGGMDQQNLSKFTLRKDLFEGQIKGKAWNELQLQMIGMGVLFVSLIALMRYNDKKDVALYEMALKKKEEADKLNKGE